VPTPFRPEGPLVASTRILRFVGLEGDVSAGGPGYTTTVRPPVSRFDGSSEPVRERSRRRQSARRYIRSEGDGAWLMREK